MLFYFTNPREETKDEKETSNEEMEEKCVPWVCEQIPIVNNVHY